LRARLADRTGHFMPVSLLDSQVATLEPLADDEFGVAVDGSAPLDVVISTACRAIDAWSANL
jgi:gluconate kinase